MTRRPIDRQRKDQAPSGPPSRFTPKAFLLASPETVQRLCEELAAEAAARFASRRGTTWTDVGTSIVAQVRASGHDLTSLDDSLDDSEELRRWQAVWYHPRGTFTLLLCFRAPASVEVTWQTDTATFAARA